MTYEQIVNELQKEIEGGDAMFNLFMWLEENPTVKEDDACRAYDDHFFVCTDCDWNLPIGCMSKDREYVCTDCSEVYDEDSD